jgi:hypothetical protein
MSEILGEAEWRYTDDAEFPCTEPCWHTGTVIDDCVWCQRLEAEAARADSERYWRTRIERESAGENSGWVPSVHYEAVCTSLDRLKEVVGDMTTGNKRLANLYKNRRRRVTRLIEECRVLYAERRETRRVLRKIIQLGGEYSVFSGTAEETLSFIKDLVSEFYKSTTRPIKPSVFVAYDSNDVIQEPREFQ